LASGENVSKRDRAQLDRPTTAEHVCEPDAMIR
jgi:hypothetical protein